MKRARKTNLNDAPIAVASDATLFVNMTHAFEVPVQLGTFIEKLVADGYEVFVGVPAPPRVRAKLVAGLDDALAEQVGVLGPELRGRRRSR